MNRISPPTRTVTHTATLAVWTLAVALATTVSMRLAPITDRTRRLRDDEAGASDLVTVVLITAVAAAGVLAVWGIIETFVLNEANNLPSSGN